jgi:hypothetical protein
MLCYAMLCTGCKALHSWYGSDETEKSPSYFRKQFPASLLPKLQGSQYQAGEIFAAIRQWGTHAIRENFLTGFPSNGLM